MKKPKPSPTSRPAPFGERLTLVAICGAVVTVPLAIWPGILQYALLPKWLVLQVGAALGCLGWALRNRGERRAGWTATPLALPALCGLGVGLLSAWGTSHPLDTTVELLDRAALIALMFVAVNAISLERLTPVLWAGALTGLVVGVIGVLQYHSLSWIQIPSKAPPAVTFANRNLAAEYLICAIPLSGLLFLKARGRLSLAASGLSATLMGVYLVYVRARGAWVGMAGAVLAVALASAVWPELRAGALEAWGALMDRSRRLWALGCLLLFLLLALLPPYRTVLPEAKSDVAATAASVLQKEVLEEDAGIRDRLAFWKNTLRMVADHPLLGVGPGGWVRAYPPYDRGATLRLNTVLHSPHNDYLWVASEEGLIGLGIYLWFLVAGLGCIRRMALRREGGARLTAPLFAVSVLAVLGDGLFGFPRSQPQAMLFLYLIFGLAAGATAGEGNREKISPLPPRGRGWGRGLPFFFLTLSLAAAVFSWRRIEFDRHYLNALTQGASRNWPGLLSEVQEALNYGTFRPQILYVRNVGLQNLGRYPEMEEGYRQALACTPHDWRLHAGLGAALMRGGRFQDALTHLQTALDLCPGAIFLRRNLYEACRRTGETERAAQTLRDILRTTPGDAWACLELGNLTYEKGNLQEAVTAYRAFLSLAPNDTAGVRLARDRIARSER